MGYGAVKTAQWVANSESGHDRQTSESSLLLSSTSSITHTLLLSVFRFDMHRRILSRRSLAIASLATGTFLGGGYYYLNSGPSYPLPSKETRRPPPPWTPPSRKEMLDSLVKSGSGSGEEFDVLIIGGGATGAGVAVDAATRGLKVALVERDDFSSGAWSRTAPPFLQSEHMLCVSC